MSEGPNKSEGKALKRAEILRPGQHGGALPHAIRRRKDLSPAAKLVFGDLIDRLGENTEAWPSIRLLAMDNGLSERGVQKAIEQLQKLKLVGVIAGGGSRSNSNRYIILSTGEQSSPVNPVRGCKEFTPEQSAPVRVNRVPSTGEQSANEPIKEPPKVTTKTEFPSELDNDAFKTAWAEWLQHKGRKYKPLGQKKQLNALSEMGSVRAIAAINHSLAQGWQGIYEGNGNGRSNFKPYRTEEQRAELDNAESAAITPEQLRARLDATPASIAQRA